VCVLATVLDAVDPGYRVILVPDALLTVYHRRYSMQIETADAEDVLRNGANG
jgi:nicotinamidase-related amidase